MTKRNFPPLLYGHRGAPLEEPENTIASFRRALACGANALETDAHLTKDGHIVLSHDETGRRMAGVPKAIANATLAEVRGWNVGHHFRRKGQSTAVTYTMPTLEEALEEFPNVPFNVDAKSRSPETVRTLIGVIGRRNAECRVRIASFYWASLRRARKLQYAGALGLSQPEVLLVLGLPKWLLTYVVSSGGAIQIPTHVRGIRLDTAEFIAKCHALGLRVDYWTINSPEEAQTLLERGADGIITDDPAGIASVFYETVKSAKNVF